MGRGSVKLELPKNLARYVPYALLGGLLLLLLYLSGLYSALLSHSLAALLGVVMAWGTFLVAWKSRRFLGNSFFVLIGMAYLFIGGLDLAYALAHEGLEVFPGYAAGLSAQLWIAGRLLQGISLLVASFFIGRKVKPVFPFVGYAVFTLVLFGAIFCQRSFPPGLVEGMGSTLFRMIGEFVVCLLLVATLILLTRKRREVDGPVLHLLQGSIVVAIASELVVSFGVATYDLLGLFGHFLQIVATFLLFRAIVEAGYRKPLQGLLQRLRQSELLLQNEQDFASSILQAVRYPLLALGADLRVLSANPAFYETFHLSPEETEGKRLYELGEGQWEIPRLLGYLRDAQSEDVLPEGFLADYTSSDLGGRTMLLNARRIKRVDLKETIILLSLEDVTEPAHTEQRLRLQAAALESAANGIVIADRTGIIIWTNPAWTHLTGYTAEEAVGQSLWQVSSGLQERAFYPQVWETVLSGQIWHGEITDRRKGGTPYTEEMTVTPVRDMDGRISHCVAIIQDVTMRKQAERMLLQRTNELQARNEELDAFAHTVAHDLKGTLTSVVGYAETVERFHKLLPSETIHEYLGTIAQAARKTSSIIEELLLLASMHRSGVKLHPLDMAEIVAEVQQRLAYMIGEYQAEVIAPDTWPVGLGYGPWVEEVWYNYISNALKYGGRPPRVELGATEQADDMVRFWVRDNGPGLTPEEQRKLFRPYARMRRVSADGLGLGLSIVRRIVEKLGGQVGMESEVGKGSVFSFTLPSGHLGGESAATMSSGG